MSFLDDSELSELNNTWRNLLGVSDSSLTNEADSATESMNQSSVSVPVVADPWGELLHAQGIELVDLQQPHPQKIHVLFSEQEVEQALQFLQEQ